MFREGQQIGVYTLVSKLGRGGFGEVWLAERKSKFVTTKVAVKLPHDEQIDPETIKQEAQLWEQASGHPNILPIIDADEYDGQIVIVSEYAPDGSLGEWLKRNGVMPIEKAVETTIKILDGLEFLHSRNIIHRDLKPANILLQGDTPRLADFGISRALRTTATSQSSNISGTFAYMPPEGFDGKRSVQTDIWSVGVNLYQFLTGALPFPNKEPSALIAAIMMRQFEPLPPDVPQNLQNVIAKALAKQPENRYASAAAMREDLRRVLRGEAVADFIQPDSRQNFSTEQATQIRKSASASVQNPQDENETVVRSTPSSEKGNLTKQERLEKLNDELESISNRRNKESQHYQRTVNTQPIQSVQPIIKGRNLVIAVFAILLISLLSIGGFFIWYEQQKQREQQQGQWLSNHNSYSSTPVYPSETPKPKKKTPKSEPNKIDTNVNTYVEPQTSTDTLSQTNRHCYLTSSSGTVNIRKDCNVKDCDDDDATIAGSISNGVEIDFKGVSVPSRFGFQWEKVLIDETGVYWVASSKISCEN